MYAWGMCMSILHARAMNAGSTNDLLQNVERALCYVAGSLCSSTAGIDLNSSCSDGPLLAIENILQRLVVLQPFLCVDFPEINQVLRSIRAVVEEMIALEDESRDKAGVGGGQELRSQKWNC